MTESISDAKTPAQIALAFDCLRQGNMAAADIVCRLVIDRDPRHAQAWNILGAVAMRLGLFEKASEYFQAAGECGASGTAGGLELAAKMAGRARPGAVQDAPRYLVIKSWGAGFWSDVSHVLGGLLLAEITDRVPVVHWGANSLFGDGSGRDAFTLYFEPIGATTVHDLIALESAGIFPGKWHRANLFDENNAKWAGDGSPMGAILFLNRPETIAVADSYVSVAILAPWIGRGHPLAALSLPDLYGYLIQKYLRPVDRLAAAARTFRAEHFGAETFVAAHIRGSDKIGEDPDLAAATAELMQHLDAVPTLTRLFVMTDDERNARLARARYGARVVLSDSRRTENDRGIHLSGSVDGRRLGEDVMKDVYIALQASAFVGIGTSNPSAMIALMKPWPASNCRLIGRSRLLRRSAIQFLPGRYADPAR